MSTRLTELDINQKLDKKMTAFYTSVYSGELPLGIIGVFKDAVYHAIPNSHQVSIPLIRSIISKKQSELTVGEVGSILNVLRVVPWDHLYPDLQMALERHEEVERLILRFNKAVDVFQKALEKERLALLAIAGVRTNGGGMRIIPHS